MGLFLNVRRFGASITQGHPIGHQSRPAAPFLIYATYLWAIRLSQDPSVKAYESSYLLRVQLPFCPDHTQKIFCTRSRRRSSSLRISSLMVGSSKGNTTFRTPSRLLSPPSCTRFVHRNLCNSNQLRRPVVCFPHATPWKRTREF